MNPADGRVVSNFIVQALTGKDLTVYGDGSYTRSFQYVDDLIDGMMAMMSQSGFKGPVNIGNPGEFTILELAKLVVELTNSTSNIDFLPPVPHDPKRRKANVDLAKKELGWQPQVSLRDGLAKTIRYFQSCDL